MHVLDEGLKASKSLMVRQFGVHTNPRQLFIYI